MMIWWLCYDYVMMMLRWWWWVDLQLTRLRISAGGKPGWSNLSTRLKIIIFYINYDYVYDDVYVYDDLWRWQTRMVKLVHNAERKKLDFKFKSFFKFSFLKLRFVEFKISWSRTFDTSTTGYERLSKLICLFRKGCFWFGDWSPGVQDRWGNLAKWPQTEILRSDFFGLWFFV